MRLEPTHETCDSSVPWRLENRYRIQSPYRHLSRCFHVSQIRLISHPPWISSINLSGGPTCLIETRCLLIGPQSKVYPVFGRYSLTEQLYLLEYPTGCSNICHFGIDKLLYRTKVGAPIPLIHSSTSKPTIHHPKYGLRAQ